MFLGQKRKHKDTFQNVHMIFFLFLEVTLFDKIGIKFWAGRKPSVPFERSLFAFLDQFDTHISLDVCIKIRHCMGHFLLINSCAASKVYLQTLNETATLTQFIALWRRWEWIIVCMYWRSRRSKISFSSLKCIMRIGEGNGHCSRGKGLHGQIISLLHISYPLFDDHAARKKVE